MYALRRRTKWCADVMRQLTRNFLVKKNTVIIPQPPYSPGLTLYDVFVFPKTKQTLKRTGICIVGTAPGHTKKAHIKPTLKIQKSTGAKVLCLRRLLWGGPNRCWWINKYLSRNLKIMMNGNVLRLLKFATIWNVLVNERNPSLKSSAFLQFLQF